MLIGSPISRHVLTLVKDEASDEKADDERFVVLPGFADDSPAAAAACVELKAEDGEDQDKILLGAVAEARSEKDKSFT